MSDSSTLVNKLWSYCNVLRDDGLSYGDYTEQLTYLLFLKMADEYTKPPWKRPSPVPEGYDWPSLMAKDGDALEAHYRKTLEHLGQQPGLLKLVFLKSQNKIGDPAKVREARATRQRARFLARSGARLEPWLADDIPDGDYAYHLEGQDLRTFQAMVDTFDTQFTAVVHRRQRP